MCENSKQTYFQNAIFTLNLRNGQSQSVSGLGRKCFVLVLNGKDFTWRHVMVMMMRFSFGNVFLWWYFLIWRRIRPDRGAVATPNHWLEGRHHHVHNQHSLFHTNMTMIIMIISKSPQWSSWTEQPFTPYSWLVEQRPGGQTIFLKITEVLPKIFLAFQDKWNTAKLISSRSPRFYSFRIRM